MIETKGRYRQVPMGAALKKKAELQAQQAADEARFLRMGGGNRNASNGTQPPSFAAADADEVLKDLKKAAAVEYPLKVMYCEQHNEPEIFGGQHCFRVDRIEQRRPAKSGGRGKYEYLVKFKDSTALSSADGNGAGGVVAAGGMVMRHADKEWIPAHHLHPELIDDFRQGKWDTAQANADGGLIVLTKEQEAAQRRAAGSAAASAVPLVPGASANALGTQSKGIGQASTGPKRNEQAEVPSKDGSSAVDGVALGVSMRNGALDAPLPRVSVVPRFKPPHNDPICGICEKPASAGSLIKCTGVCGRSYHRRCLNLPMTVAGLTWKCVECATDTHCCFACGGFARTHHQAFRTFGSDQDGSVAAAAAAAAIEGGGNGDIGKVGAAADVLQQCEKCARFYHQKCLIPVVGEGLGPFSFSCCPWHLCHRCGEPGSVAEKRPLLRCFRCPLAYHPECAPPSCKKIFGGYIACNYCNADSSTSPLHDAPYCPPDVFAEPILESRVRWPLGLPAPDKVKGEAPKVESAHEDGKRKDPPDATAAHGKRPKP